MRNIFINEYNRKIKRNIISKNYYGISGTSSEYGDNNGGVNIAVKEIRKKIQDLPEIFIKPFNLYFEGYKYHEIAFAMNEPLGTIKSRIHFARKLLKEQIQRN
jgi:RNA polymerase sigma-70 factor (ECF subfamily)